MEIEQPPSYSESSSPVQVRRPPRDQDGPIYLGPPPPYSSQEELLTSLLQTDADGSSSTEVELPPSYEEVIAGLSVSDLHRDVTDSIPTDQEAAGSSLTTDLRAAQAPHARSSWSGPTSQRSVVPSKRVINIPKACTDQASLGYGFAFRGNRVTVVLPNGPASHAGLTQGLVILEVNGFNVENKDKNFILQKIKSREDGVRLLVEDPVVWSQPSFSWLTFTIKRPEAGYGFAFRGVHISVVLPNSEAAKAGLYVGDTLLKINGQRTDGLDRAGLLELINLNPDQVQVTVTRREHGFHFRQPTCYRLNRSPATGYGFAFRGSRISALLPGCEAERKGLRIGDRLIEINGHNVARCGLNDILRHINERRDDVTLVVLPDVTPMSTG